MDTRTRYHHKLKRRRVEVYPECWWVRSQRCVWFKHPFGQFIVVAIVCLATGQHKFFCSARSHASSCTVHASYCKDACAYFVQSTSKTTAQSKGSKNTNSQTNSANDSKKDTPTTSGPTAPLPPGGVNTNRPFYANMT